MKNKRLYIFIEGDDDEIFFEKIIKYRLEERYNSVKLWKHAQKTKKQIKNFLRSIKAMKADYIYVADINHTLCITGKKQKIQNRYNNLNKDRIIVVIKEIESWYLAGLDDKASKQLGVSACDTTDLITKEQFYKLIPAKFDSRIDFMLEILKHFSINTAKEKNRSFRYFLEKHLNF
ncbi:MAG: hypothetical protein ACE5EA_10725 [Nitrospirota bacterium]